MGINHTRNVNVPAIAAKATPACAARADTVPRTSAPPELLPDEDEEVPVEVASGAEAARSVEVSEAGMKLGPAKEVAGSTVPEEGAAEVLFEPVPGEVVFPPLMYGGAGLAVDGSTRAPVPQGIFSPSGCV
jgi:hypothetical protein